MEQEIPIVTYNFDPEKWYDNQRSTLERRRSAQELSEAAFEKAIEELDRRYEEMWNRLDGTFTLPEESGGPG